MAEIESVEVPEIVKEQPKPKLTTAALDKLLRTRPHRQQVIWDGKQPGLCVLVSRGPSSRRQATVTLRCLYFMKGKLSKPRYIKIGRYPDGEFKLKDEDGKEHIFRCSDLDKVRDKVRAIRSNAKLGIDPKRELNLLRAASNFADVVTDFIELHAKKNNRMWGETKRIFDRYVLPSWGGLNIAEIEQDHVTALLDKIEQGKIAYTSNNKTHYIGAPIQADATLAQLTKLFNWYATRKSGFRTPIVKGMRRGKPATERARKRVLTDSEIRALWSVLDDETFAVYGAVVKCALLTAQRFKKVANMQRGDLKKRMRIDSHMVDGQLVPEAIISDVWDPTRDDDPKNKQVSPVPLSLTALSIIGTVPVVDGDGDFVFSLNGDAPIRGWGRYKRWLDKAMLAKLRAQAAADGEDPHTITLKPWQHRDLRRTARTLMARTGIISEIAERCLAHKIAGVEGVYNRYEYLREKRDAFAKLASFVERIVNPPTDNVVPLTTIGRA